MSSSKDPSLCLVLSDLHFGKITDDFNLDVAYERLTSYVDKLKAHPARPTKVKEIRLLLIGDMVEGNDIYPHQNAVSGSATVWQIEKCRAALGSVIESLKGLYKDARIIADCVFGNHGRSSKSAHPESNWDLALYHHLRTEYRADKRVSVRVHTQEFVPVSISGTRGLLAHHGIPHVSTRAPAHKFVAWMLKYNTSWMVVGHCHHIRLTAECDRLFMGNGSLCGTDDFSTKLALFSKPQQMWFCVTQGVGVHSINWVEWPQ